MQTELLIQLSQLKPLICGLLFFWVSWLATKKILLLAILGISAGETAFDSMHGQLEAISSNPYVLQAASALGVPLDHGSIMTPLIANILLGLAMFALAQAIKTYGSAKRLEAQLELRVLQTHGRNRGKAASYHDANR